MRVNRHTKAAALVAALLCALGANAPGKQERLRAVDDAGARGGSSVRSITIPVAVSAPTPERGSEEIRPLGLTLLEDGERQEILSTRSQAEHAPLYLSIFIQDDLLPPASNEIAPLADFIRHLPEGSYVMVGYLRSGSIQIRQKFTNDLARAAKALRVPIGVPSAGPYNPYSTIVEGLKRYQSQPVGRRAVLVITDGLDISRGIDSSIASMSTDLQRAINEAQRRGVAIYSIFTPTANTERNATLVSNGQSSLERLSEETGGKAFFHGTGAPVSYDPYLRELSDTLDRQIAITYLSTHESKGFHKIKLVTALEGAHLAYPSGYTRK